MFKRDQAKLIKFNWRDIVAIVTVVAITATVFVWTLTQQNSSGNSGDEAYVVARYKDQVLTESLPTRNSLGEKIEYSVSFRRNTVGEETYANTFDGTIKYVDAIDLANLTDPGDLDGFYIVVSSSGDDAYGGFTELNGPQVDIYIHDFGFEVSLEESPENVCSKQGFMTQENFPVVCMPNELYFWLASAVYSGPDA